MRRVRPRLPNTLEEHTSGYPARSAPYELPSYDALVQTTAQLAFLNKDFLLFFRGQGIDHRNKAGSSTFYPAIYRGDPVSRDELVIRFERLDRAARLLVSEAERTQLTGARELRRRRYIQWSLLQHYSIVPTPLLDFTHSLRVACSFAQDESETDHAYVYVFALPYLSNRISVNSEHDLVNVRLLSISPPEALRPYFQDGYLAGTDEVTTDFDKKDELDFNNRLVATFSIPSGDTFWPRGFAHIPREMLYPEPDDVLELSERIRQRLTQAPASPRASASQRNVGLVGMFLEEWTQLEGLVFAVARSLSAKEVRSFKKATDTLARRGLLPHSLRNELDAMRRFRNEVVHSSVSRPASEYLAAVDRIGQLRTNLEDGQLWEAL